MGLPGFFRIQEALVGQLYTIRGKYFTPRDAEEKEDGTDAADAQEADKFIAEETLAEEALSDVDDEAGCDEYELIAFLGGGELVPKTSEESLVECPAKLAHRDHR